MSLGEMIRERRWGAGLTQRELAARLGIDPTYVSKIENDRDRPGARTIIQMAAALDCDPLPLLHARRKAPPVLHTLTVEQWSALSLWLSEWGCGEDH